MINLIFVSGEMTAGLAHVDFHCVTGIALPPVDATFHRFSGRCARGRRKTLGLGWNYCIGWEWKVGCGARAPDSDTCAERPSSG